MSGNQIEMVLKPIGFVRNNVHEYKRQNWEEMISEVVVKPELADSLDGLAEFSHLIVLFWTGKTPPVNPPLKIHPRNNPDLPLVGLFATRSPDRPNPVCLTTVRLLERSKNILIVKGLDAFDSTLVIDIKPYLPANELVMDVKVPVWVSSNNQN